MGKHRGGDPLKSLRFARKALDLYTQGLSKYPRNFDLAYNKARLELEIATHPSLVKALDVPVTNVLQQALASHRYAVSLDPDNADTLFNTAQVLTTIAEYIAKDDATPDTAALPYLEEALERQNRCLDIQHTKFADSQNIHEAAVNQNMDDDDDDIQDEDGGAKLDANTTSVYEEQTQEQQEQWFSIIEPVTANTLVDTVLSQLGTLTTLCTILTSSLTATSSDQLPISPAWIESYSNNLTTSILPSLMSDSANTEQLSPRISEVHRTQSIFTASLFDLAFHTQSINSETYLTNLTTTFSRPGIDPREIDPETQIAYARALMTLNSSIAESTAASSLPVASSSSSSPSSISSPTASTASSRWTILTRTTTLLTTTSQHSQLKSSNDPTNRHLLATTHLLRGDIALLMSTLANQPYFHPQAVSNKPQLLKNAEVFYRNAGKLFGSNEEEGDVARFRGMIVGMLQGQEMAGNGLKGIAVRDLAWRRAQLGEMVDEGLLEGVDLAQMGLLG